MADGALSETHDILQRMNELAVQSANGTNSAADRAAIENEKKELVNDVGINYRGIINIIFVKIAIIREDIVIGKIH